MPETIYSYKHVEERLLCSRSS